MHGHTSSQNDRCVRRFLLRHAINERSNSDSWVTCYRVGFGYVSSKEWFRLRLSILNGVTCSLLLHNRCPRKMCSIQRSTSAFTLADADVETQRMIRGVPLRTRYARTCSQYAPDELQPCQLTSTIRDVTSQERRKVGKLQVQAMQDLCS